MQVVFTDTELRYLAIIEKKIRAILASIESCHGDRPRLARWNWPEGQRIPDHFRTLHNMMMADWSKKQTRNATSQLMVKQAELVLDEIGKLGEEDRYVLWLRLQYNTWADIHYATKHKYTNKQLKEKYDVALGRIAMRLAKS